ncbi:MAG: glycosyltransferase [Candidatus Omnitrophica bacterium]|nr:glycosyltransferase [Candidatus Omnitrophota bacterium]
MKILIIVDRFPKLSETFILNQIPKLLEQNHELSIVSYDGGPLDSLEHDVAQQVLLKVPVIHFKPTPQSRTMRGFKKMRTLIANRLYQSGRRRIISEILKYPSELLTRGLLYEANPFVGGNHFDIIYAHFGKNGIRGMLMRKLYGLRAKLVTVFHGYDVSQFIQKHGRDIYADLFESGDFFLPVSEYFKKRLVGFGCPEEKIKVHHTGIDCEKFKPSPSRPNHSTSRRLLSIGRLVEKKGFEYGIRAFARLQEKYNDLEYHIVGDGPLWDSNQLLIKELGLYNSVKMHGAKTDRDIVEMLHSSDILLAPSVTAENGDQEGIPGSLMQAMACGLPVVSTLHSGIPELVEDGVSGFLAPERNAEVLAEKLEYLLEHPELWEPMGKAGRLRVAQDFEINKQVAGILRMFSAAQACSSSCSGVVA